MPAYPRVMDGLVPAIYCRLKKKDVDARPKGRA
jgi:hypothetical protein